MQELSEKERIDALASHIEAVIKLLGEDPTREGLLKTPQRAAKALWFLTSGYRENASAIIEQAMFENEGSQLIVVKDIEFYSMCEHHILPFFGKVSIGYIPGDKIVGLSKLARIVNVYARRLQVQERFTAQICEEVRKTLGAKGVIVSCSGEHLCMKMRGVEKQHSSTTTMHYNGVFETDATLRAEFFEAIK
ncbi:MAG: GTP cyclohydrolase I FolE [Muribaculaceae bacterium]|nr:GTP cyclohydrolase I FolE [Muribaculaceae bacterium]